jgi:hypothetical protein
MVVVKVKPLVDVIQLTQLVNQKVVLVALKKLATNSSFVVVVLTRVARRSAYAT